MSQAPQTVELADLVLATNNRYQFNRLVGRGAYGIVIAATDKVTGRDVAVKRVEHLFDSNLDAKRILREIRCLAALKHENITNIVEVCAEPTFDDFHSIVLVMDLMDTDMYQIINSGQPLLKDHVRYFVYQTLRGLKYIHSANILHRDLKPANLLLNANCDLKIADFGLARVKDPENGNEFLSEYVATRWYRAPEVLLNYDTYGPAIDVWSVGCILAELILRHPLFPGQSTMNQLAIINNVLGSPTEEDLEECTNPKARAYMESLPKRTKVPLAQLLPGVDADVLDMIEKMLTWDPRKRMTVEEGLEHPFVASLHDPMDEPITFPLDEFEFERPDITMAEMKELMWKEVLRYRQ